MTPGMTRVSLTSMGLLRVFVLSVMALASGWAGVAVPPAPGQTRGEARAIEDAWLHLDAPDRAVRAAARLAIEAQPFDSWKGRALGETRTWAALEALLALVRSCPRAQADELRPHVCEGITTLHLEEMRAEQRLAAVRLTRLVFARLGGPAADERRQMLDLWSRFLPAKSGSGADERQFDKSLRALLKFLALPDAPPK